MKKIIVFLMCINLFCLQTLADEIFQDNLVEKTLKNKTLNIKPIETKPIVDVFVETSLKNKTSETSANTQTIEDNLVNKNLSNKKYEIKKQESVAVSDVLVNKTLKPGTKTQIKKLHTNSNYDMLGRIPIKIVITEDISSQNNLKEGEELNFKVKQDVKINSNLIIKKDTVIKARLENVSLNEAFGVPADMVVDNFKLVSNNTQLNFEGSIHKIGANRSLWVYPVGSAGTCFFGIGALLFTVRGGHAKIKTTDTYEVYFIPDSI